MAIIKTEQILLSNWTTYLASLDNRIVAGADSVTIDNQVILDLPMYNDRYAYRYMRITVNGIQHVTGDWYSSMDLPYVQSIVDDNFIIIRFTPSTYTPPFGGHEFIFVNGGNDRWYAGVQHRNNDQFIIYNNPLYYTMEGSSIYYLYKLFNFSVDVGKLAYYPDLRTPIVSSGGILSGMVQGIVSCSTTGYNSSISMPNGINYYSISTNAMVRIDAV